MSDELNDPIPPTEPSAAPKKRGPYKKRQPSAVEDAPAAIATAPAPRSATRISGADLVPDLNKHRGSVERGYFYWVGVTPSCPVEGVDCAGINFPKVNERLIAGRNGEQQRVPVIGALVRLSERKIRLLRERLPRVVVRFTRDDQGVKEEPGTGQNLGDLHIRPRKGFLITIPTEADLKQREQRGIAARRYVQGPNDEPAARYMFARLCRNQEIGERGDTYPDTLANTGLDWPDELE